MDLSVFGPRSQFWIRKLRIRGSGFGPSATLQFDGKLLAQSREAPTYFVVARRGKSASVSSSSAPRRAISRRSQLSTRDSATRCQAR
jgi:hypothetical protein